MTDIVMLQGTYAIRTVRSSTCIETMHTISLKWFPLFGSGLVFCVETSCGIILRAESRESESVTREQMPSLHCPITTSLLIEAESTGDGVGWSKEEQVGAGGVDKGVGGVGWGGVRRSRWG